MNKQVSENPAKNRGLTALTIVSALLATLYIASNAMAVKVIAIGDLALFDAGTITFPAAYMLGDVLTEVWGFKTAKKVIWLTFLCNLIFVLCTALGLVLPAPDYMEETTKAYAIIFGYVPRIVIASLAGFLCGELSNAFVMSKMKALTKGKYMWLRTIGSSAVGYIFDTVLFVLVAFWGTAPGKDLFSMITIQYGAKLLIEALCGTPLAYLAVHIIRKKERDKNGIY